MRLNHRQELAVCDMAAAATDLSAAPHAGVAGAPQGAGAGMAFVRILFYAVPMDDEELSLPEGLRVAGRGARRNMSGRFEAETRAPVHDGWSIAEEARPLRTELRAERPRRIIARNDSPDIPFDRGLNPYRGCEHGCAYCYARATHAHLGLSPGLDFESRLVMRPQAPAVLARELRARGYDPRPMAIGTATDPYQPAEQAQRITRGVLEVLREFSHPATITTRGALIARDLDILAPMAARGLMRVGISIATLDPDLSRRLEPRAPAPARRLEAIAALAAAGVPVQVMIAPVIPALTDHELEAILAAGARAGARCAQWLLLRLPNEVAPLFLDWLARHEPGRAARVRGRLREMHGGRDYDAAWGRRMRGQGPHAALLARRFEIAARRNGLDRVPPPLDCTQFAPPPRAGDQLALF